MGRNATEWSCSDWSPTERKDRWLQMPSRCQTPALDESNVKPYQFFPQTNIPGYQGFIPLRVFDCGSTFGRSADPVIRKNVVNNMREKHWRTGPAFMSDTLAATKVQAEEPVYKKMGAIGAAEKPTGGCADGQIP